MTATSDAIAWIDARYAAGATRIGSSCDPVHRRVWLTSDLETEWKVINCGECSENDTRVIGDEIHDYIARLPPRTSGDFVPGTDNVGGTYTPRKRKR